MILSLAGVSTYPMIIHMYVPLFLLQRAISEGGTAKGNTLIFLRAQIQRELKAALNQKSLTELILL